MNLLPGKHVLINASQCNKILENTKIHPKCQKSSRKKHPTLIFGYFIMLKC